MALFPKSFAVATTLSAYRGVALSSTENTVIYPTTITTALIGVTTDDVDDTNQGIPVATAGEEALLYFNDTLSAGDAVAIDTSGRGIPFAGITSTGTHILGYAQEAVAATGTIARVLIQPQMRYGND